MTNKMAFGESQVEPRFMAFLLSIQRNGDHKEKFFIFQEVWVFTANLNDGSMINKMAVTVLTVQAYKMSL